MLSKGSLRRARILHCRSRKTALQQVTREYSSAKLQSANPVEVLCHPTVPLSTCTNITMPVFATQRPTVTVNQTTEQAPTQHDVDQFVDKMAGHLRADLRKMVPSRTRGTMFQRGLLRRAEDNAIHTATQALRAAVGGASRNKTTFTKIGRVDPTDADALLAQAEAILAANKNRKVSASVKAEVLSGAKSKTLDATAKTNTQAAQPVVVAKTSEPVVEVKAPETPVQVKVEQPKTVEVTVEQPKVEVPVESTKTQVKVGTKVEQPVVETKTEQPKVVETQAAQPKAESKPAEPKPASKNNSHQQGGKSTKKGASFLHRVLKVFGGLSALLGGVYVWNHFIDPVHEQDLKQLFPILEEPEVFEHPLNSSSYLYQCFFWLTRMTFLLYVFTPLIFNYAAYVIGGSTPEGRQGFLNAIVARLERAGCSFLKFGQWLSMRPDMFEADIINVLSKLRDKSPAHSLAETYSIIKSELGEEVGSIFEHFEPEPIASGSIAQVYRARLSDEWVNKAQLRNEKGELVREVAVKVRHPAVVKETWMDVDLIFAFIKIHPALAVPFSKEEFGNMMQKQVDFRWEAHYITRFLHNFCSEVKDGYLRFPSVSSKVLSQGVLVESWAQGKSVADIFTDVGEGFFAHGANSLLAAAAQVPLTPFEELQVHCTQFFNFARDEVKALSIKAATVFGFDTRKSISSILRHGEDDYASTAAKHDQNLLKAMNNDQVFDVELMAKKKKLAFTLFDLFLKMFLRDNLIHGDLHAGNVLFDQADSACTVLDAGMTVSLGSDVQDSFSHFLYAICDGDPDKLVKQIQVFEINRPGLPAGSGQGYLAHDPVIREELRKDLEQVCNVFFRRSSFMGLEHNHRPENVSIGDVVGQILIKMQNHGIVLRGDVAASIMAMSVCEGLIRQLDPTLDIVFKSFPYFMKYKGFNMAFNQKKAD